MKIAFPVGKETGASQQVALHFGPSPWFLVLDGNGRELAAVKNTSTHFGGNKMPVELLAENGIGAIICCDMGPKAVEMCRRHSMAAYFAPVGASVQEAFALYVDGKLKKAGEGDGCKSHVH